MIIRRLNHLLEILLDWIIGSILSIIVIILFIGVILRYVFNSPLFWSEEIAVLGLIWVTFLSGAILVRQNKNVCITVITDICNKRVSDRIQNFGDLLVLVILIVMSYQSWRLKGRLSLSTTPALRISEAWFGWAMIIGFLMMLYYQIQRVIAIFTGKKILSEQTDGEDVCRL